MMGSWKDRGNHYIQLVKVLYCKLPTTSKQLPGFPCEVGPGTEPRSQRWEESVTTLPPWPLTLATRKMYKKSRKKFPRWGLMALIHKLNLNLKP